MKKRHKLMTTVALCALLVVTGCHGLPVHQGAVGTGQTAAFDSATYDGLTAAKSLIDSARTQHDAGTLPDSLVKPVDAIIAAYDLAYPAWGQWRAAVGTSGEVAALAALNVALATLVKAEAEYGKGGK